MVRIGSRARGTRRRRSRGQLILIGSIAIALVLIGLAAVVNAVVVAESGHARTGAEAIEAGGVATLEAERGAAETIAAANVDRKYADGDEDELDESVAAETGNYSALLGESKADGSGAFAAVDYVDTEEYGTRIVQDGGGNFRDNESTQTWDPVDDAAVADFVVTIDVEESDGVLRVTASEEEDRELQIDITDEGVDLHTPDGDLCDIPSVDDEVKLLISEGRSPMDESCSFELTNATATQSVEFNVVEGEPTGNYSLIVNESIGSDDRFDGYHSGDGTHDRPHLSKVVWTGVVEIDHEAGGATTTDEREVDVYG